MKNINMQYVYEKVGSTKRIGLYEQLYNKHLLDGINSGVKDEPYEICAKAFPDKIVIKSYYNNGLVGAGDTGRILEISYDKATFIILENVYEFGDYEEKVISFDATPEWLEIRPKIESDYNAYVDGLIEYCGNVLSKALNSYEIEKQQLIQRTIQDITIKYELKRNSAISYTEEQIKTLTKQKLESQDEME